MRLQDRVCIITGAASGIGLACVRKFLAEGARVVLADRSAKALQDAADALGVADDRVLAHTVDVVERAEVDALVAATLARFGRVDALINNAGITQDAKLLKMSEAQWDAVMNVNLKGIFHCTQAAAPHMVAQGRGAIVMASSVSGIYGNFGQGNYAATKAGVVGLTKTWARELGPSGVRVNAVVPGLVQTPMLGTIPDTVMDMLKQASWLRRLGEPSELANVYAFLASDEASYVNGAVWEVSGGLSM